MSSCPRRACPFGASIVAGTCAWLLLAAASASATIGIPYQLLLGNPTGAIADTNNHSHYLIQRDIEALDYSDTLRQPNWASWHYTSGDSGSVGRTDAFAADTNLPPNFYWVKATDYSGSGYDRGHLCPSADRTDTVQHNVDTFLMDNMIPQAPDNNRGVWADLESYSRAIAASNEVLVICGPQGFGTNKTASAGQIPIASNVWKIIVAVPLGGGSTLSRITNSTRVIAVNIPNLQGIYSDPWQNYLTSVNHLQTNTGFTFFTTLNSNLAAVLRSKVDGAPACGVTNLSPNAGAAGDVVVIRGTNFTGVTSVQFNGSTATFTVNSGNQITATVPVTAMTGPVTVLAAGGLATGPTFMFNGNKLVTPPVLTIRWQGASATLTWPTNSGTFTLQTSPDLTPNSWSNFSGSILVFSTNYAATLTNPAATCFFRLAPQ